MPWYPKWYTINNEKLNVIYMTWVSKYWNEMHKSSTDIDIEQNLHVGAKGMCNIYAKTSERHSHVFQKIPGRTDNRLLGKLPKTAPFLCCMSPWCWFQFSGANWKSMKVWTFHIKDRNRAPYHFMFKIIYWKISSHKFMGSKINNPIKHNSSTILFLVVDDSLELPKGLPIVKYRERHKVINQGLRLTKNCYRYTCNPRPNPQ